MAGGPTNTLPRMPYRCMDGVEITDNLPIISFDHNIVASKIAGGENQDRVPLRMQFIKLSMNLLIKV